MTHSLRPRGLLLRGTFTLYRDGVLICARRNLVTNVALANCARVIADSSPGAYGVTLMGFGNGTAAPTTLDTGLTGTQQYINALASGTTWNGTGSVTFNYQLVAADYGANPLTVSEIGLFGNIGAAQVPYSSGIVTSTWAASTADAVGVMIKDANSDVQRSTTPPAWAVSTVEAVGNMIIDSNGNLQKVTIGGTTGSVSHPVWATVVNNTTVDNTVTWTCEALAGYTPTSGSGSAPTWPTTVGATISDGTVWWTLVAAHVAPAGIWTHALVPEFSFTGAANYTGTYTLTVGN